MILWISSCAVLCYIAWKLLEEVQGAGGKSQEELINTTGALTFGHVEEPNEIVHLVHSSAHYST